MYRQSEKISLSGNISSICLDNTYGELRPTNCWDLLASLGHPNKFQLVFASWLRYCTDVAQRRSNKLCTMFGRLLRWYTIYNFSWWGGSCHLTEFLSAAKLTLRPSLAFSYIGSVTARQSSSRASQSLGRGTRNGITELSETAPPIFGRAAITLGIGPHSNVFSSFRYFFCSVR